VEASRADSPRVERVPLVAAGARPAVVLAWRPAAEWASNAGAGRVEALLLVKLAIQDNRLMMREGAHAAIMTQLRTQIWRIAKVPICAIHQFFSDRQDDAAKAPVARV
jgi:hypothetical protein